MPGQEWNGKHQAGNYTKHQYPLKAGDVMYLSQNVVETFIDRIEVFNDEHVKIHFTFENVLADYAE